MKKFIPILLCLLCAAGCTLKLTNVEFNQEADEHGVAALSLKADNSTLETDTDQTADGNLDLGEIVKAAESLGGTDSIADLLLGIGKDKAKVVIPPLTPTSSKQGDLEVIE